MNTFNKGMVVRKKNGKPFQNKQKTAIVESTSTMIVPVSHAISRDATKEIDCVFLEGCCGCVPTGRIEEV